MPEVREVQVRTGACSASSRSPSTTRRAPGSTFPLQDFTASSDIDWSKPIPEIDQQLYAKYGLDSEEIAFIEAKVKPME